MPSWWVRYSKERKAKSDRESIIGSFHRKYIGPRAQWRQHNDTTLENGFQYKGGSQSPLPSKQVSRYQSFGERPQPQPLPLPHNRIIGCPDSGDSALIVSSVDRSSKNSMFRSPPKPWCGKIGQCAAVGERDMASDLNSSDSSSDTDDQSDSPQASDCEQGIKSDIASSSGLKQKDQPPPVNKSNSREVLKPANISSNNQASLASPKRRLINSTIAHLHIPHQGGFLSASDSSISSPSRSPMRVFGHEPSINGGFWLEKPNADLAVGSGQCSNQGSGHHLRHNSVAGDIACQPFCLQSRCSPECSPLPCSRMTSPGPSSRVHSGAASPLHPPAGGSAAESPTAWPDDGKKQSHPLPFPPAMVSSPSPLTSSGTSPWIPHSPSGAANPPSPGSCWKKGRLLGRGTYGHVYLGFNSESGEMCAMKEVILFSDDPKSRESVQQLVQEIALLSRLHHTNIVQYYGSETIDDKLYIFLEYVSGGSINKILQEYGQLGEAAIRSYTQQILSGLAYLHGKNTLHRDIKGANILVDPNGRVKLADFGMAKHITGKYCPLSFKGSPYWMAPEVIKNSGSCNLAVDIWSLGCTVLEMATTKPPWSQYEGVAAMFKIGNSNELPAIPDHLSDEGKDFVGQCLQRNPCDRPTAAQLLEHPFVKNSSSAFLSAEPTDSIPALTRAVRALGFGNSVTSYLDLSGAVNHSKNQKDVPGSSDGYVARNISCPVSPIGSPLSRSQSPQFSGRSSPSPISSPRATSGASTPLGGGNIGTPQYHRKTINYQHEGMGMVSRPQNTFHQNGNGYQ